MKTTEAIQEQLDKAENIKLESKRERILARNTAIALLRDSLRDDLFKVIPAYKGLISGEGLESEVWDVFNEVQEDDAYEIQGEESLL